MTRKCALRVAISNVVVCVVVVVVVVVVLLFMNEAGLEWEAEQMNEPCNKRERE